MKMNRVMLAAAIGVLALAAAVHAQVSVPQLQTLGQTDLIQVLPGGQPSAQSQYATLPKITNVTGYYTVAPLTGFVYSFTSGITNAAFVPAGTLASGYVTLATTPSDGSVNCVFSTAAITAIYICTASTGLGNCTTTGVNNGITTLAANATACYFYSRSASAWYRMR